MEWYVLGCMVFAAVGYEAFVGDCGCFGAIFVDLQAYVLHDVGNGYRDGRQEAEVRLCCIECVFQPQSLQDVFQAEMHIHAEFWQFQPYHLSRHCLLCCVPFGGVDVVDKRADAAFRFVWQCDVHHVRLASGVAICQPDHVKAAARHMWNGVDTCHHVDDGRCSVGTVEYAFRHIVTEVDGPRCLEVYGICYHE